MALSGNQRPDHSTIAAYVSSMQDQILSLYCNILLVCEQENLLGGTFFALDGVKLAANASKDNSGSLSELKNKKDKIQQKTNFSKAMQNKIDSDRGRKIYPQRFAVVEPVFANIKTQKRLDRFTLRGKIKVNIQWMLYCMVHNIEKIMNFAMA
jgi:hypothetical protein